MPNRRGEEGGGTKKVSAARGTLGRLTVKLGEDTQMGGGAAQSPLK